MKKVVILGIDGMDFAYVNSIISELPTIRALSESGKIAALKSVFPPDSIPSWITCYTGKDPSEHGILESVNYFAKGGERLKVDTSAFKGSTFWDVIGKSGRKVCVINPFMAYPVWPVNGVMVNGPVFIDGKIQVSDPDYISDIEVPESLGGIVDFPTKKTLRTFIEKTFSDTADQAEFGLAVLKQKQPDLYFQTFLTMDRIQHFLWRYCDRNDPTYPGPTPYETSIKKFYVFIDQIIGRFIEILDPEDELIVISDHGHGMRCTHCFNINEFLRKHGYVRSIAEGKMLSKQLIIEKMKNSILDFMNEHNLEDYISKVAKLVPNAQKFKKGKHITSSSRNKAYASDFTGTNPFGGIVINKDLVDDYEKTKTDIIDLLAGITVNGEAVFKWIRKREVMFSGEFLDRFPDILFCLNSQYGVNWNLHTQEFTLNPTHKKVSGGHNENGVLFSNIPASRFADYNLLEMKNFFATILALCGIEGPGLSTGKSFIKTYS